MGEQQERAISAAGEMTAALQAVAGRLDRVRRDSEERDAALAAQAASLKKYGRHNRVFIAIDILLTVVTTFAVVKAVGASDQAAQNHQAAIVSCQSTNEARAQNEQLWTYLLSLSRPPQNATEAQKERQQKLLGLLRGKIEVTFAPRDCQALARGEKP